MVSITWCRFLQIDTGTIIRFLQYSDDYRGGSKILITVLICIKLYKERMWDEVDFEKEK